MKKITLLILAMLLSTAGLFAQPVLMNSSSIYDYTIIYELNGGTNASSNAVSYSENETVTLAAPTRNGYSFDGWYWDENFKNPLKDNTFSNKKGSIKVFAKWIQKFDFSAFESENMIEIIPVDNKVNLENFAYSSGPQDIFAYSISKYEVTQSLYQIVIGNNPSYFVGENNPVENLTWYDAVYFCNELTKITMGEKNCCYSISGIERDKNGRIENAYVIWDMDKKGYRLPTEAEWELAARGGLKGGWDYLYSGGAYIDDVAWYDGNTTNWQTVRSSTCSVGKKQANKAGLYDMSGNVQEWCWNIWPDRKPCRVLRGGGYNDDKRSCTVSSRNDAHPGRNLVNAGFRVCHSIINEEKYDITENFDRENMVEIIPAGSKVTKVDFASTKGSQDILAYSIGKYEVTQALYQTVIGENPSYYKRGKCPVSSVTWYDAVYFCNELTKLTMGEENCCYTITGIKKDYEGKITEATVTWDQSKKGYRLPTDAEWEMAARGGLKGGWDYIYSGSDNVDDVAWNNCDSIHEVGTKQPNMAGIYDMSGNVSEWCWNTYIHDSYYRVLRGGSSSKYDSWGLKVSACIEGYCFEGYGNKGFRICRSL